MKDKYRRNIQLALIIKGKITGFSVKIPVEILR